ncbi:hypothetical protein [Kitasatospora sp. GP82]|uniref:hypothetical protein n=1 Tax=Kitasatospora sp. GP82 TaxID=3035089 RepID=UPI00247C8796|nr:sugar/nucleoside kinase (ribokinase family) [Kitasatospora sp. GP82]
MHEYDILVVGGAGVDTVLRVERLEIPDADSVGVAPVRDYVAHTGNGVALGCHHLGLRTRFIDFLGEDPQAELILAEYARHGLAFSHLVSPAGTHTEFISAEALREYRDLVRPEPDR